MQGLLCYNTYKMSVYCCGPAYMQTQVDTKDCNLMHMTHLGEQGCSDMEGLRTVSQWSSNLVL